MLTRRRSLDEPFDNEAMRFRASVAVACCSSREALSGLVKSWSESEFRLGSGAFSNSLRATDVLISSWLRKKFRKVSFCALGPGGGWNCEDDAFWPAAWASWGVGVGGRASSKDWTKGVVMPRTGSPSAPARSFFSTSCRDKLAAFRARAWARAYGSRCRLLWATAEAWSTAEHVKVRLWHALEGRDAAYLVSARAHLAGSSQSSPLSALRLGNKEVRGGIAAQQ